MHAQQRQLVPAPAGPAEEQAAQHVEAADHAQRLRAEHRVHAAQGQVRGQVRGQEHQLHAADEVGARHHHEQRVAQRDAQCGARRCRPRPPVRHRQRIDAAGHPGGRQHQQRQQRRSPSTPDAPARWPAASTWPDRRGDQRAQRAGGRDDAEHRAAHGQRHRARRHRQRQRAAGAGQRERRSARPRPASRRSGRWPWPAAPGPACRAARRRPSAGRKPSRTAQAPASGCSRPQARFCTAMASVKSATEMPMSCVSGGMNRPRLWRRPMARLSMTRGADQDRQRGAQGAQRHGSAH